MEAAESIGAGWKERVEEWALAHEALSKLRLKRAGLDAEEGAWLLRAFRAATHVYFGYASFGEYIERLLGLSRRATEEKLRVAEALEELPELAEAVRSGELTWSAVRELSRVAVAETESEWIAVARERTVREVERMVSGLARGDRPAARRRPELVRHVLRFEVGAETLATFREAMRVLQKRSEHRLDDDAALLSMAREILGGPGDAGRASYQVVVTVCEDCGRGFQHANGELIQLDPAIVEMCHCDAQKVPIPNLHGVSADGPDGHRVVAGHVAAAHTHVGDAADFAPARSHVGVTDDVAPAHSHVGDDIALTPARAGGTDHSAPAHSHVFDTDDAALTSVRAGGTDEIAPATSHLRDTDDVGSAHLHGGGTDDFASARSHVGDAGEMSRVKVPGSGAGKQAQADARRGRGADELAGADAQVGTGRGAGVGSAGLKRQRATQETPPAIRREVFWRDRGRCIVSGCRNATYVDVHHLDLRSEGGSNDADNLVVLCGAHHGALHRGRLRIDGKVSTGLRVRHADGTVYGGMPSPLLMEASARAFAALRNLGFSEKTARASLEHALSGAPANATAETLLRSAVARASCC